MTKTLLLARRELAATFFSPMAYVIGALVLLASGLWFFYEIFIPGHEASLRPLFDAMAQIMVFAVPLLTMRSISDELRSGSVETLMTAPVSETQVVVGKFLGVWTFYVILLGLTGVYLGLVVAFGQPDFGVAAMGYLGMLLVGGLFVAAGVLASAATRYQLVAAVLAAAFLAVWTFLMPVLVARGPVPVNHLAARLSVMNVFRDFSRGVFDTRGVVFFVSGTLLLLFLGVKTLERRRWR